MKENRYEKTGTSQKKGGNVKQDNMIEINTTMKMKVKKSRERAIKRKIFKTHLPLIQR